MTRNNITHIEWIRKKIEESDTDVLRELLLDTLQALMSAQADSMCGAEYGERSDERTNSRNGYRTRRWDTRVGTLDLEIPKLRRGSYYPHWLLSPRRRSERALVQVISEAWVEGVSTRKVDRLVKSLGIDGISKSQVSDMAKSLDEKVEAFRNRPLLNGPYRYLWLDATMVKCRECGRVENVAVVIAVGVNAEGHREIIGVEVFTSEDETSWTAFMRGLVDRGLRGVRLVTSDAHPGLKKAIGSVLPGAAWQRCGTHFSRNVLSKLPKKAQDRVAAKMRSIWAQTGHDEAHEQYDRVADELSADYEDVTDLLDEGREQVLAYTRFPRVHWRKIRTNNPLENLNSQIKRRTRVVGIFPNRASVIRLVGAVLVERHEDWIAGRRYMGLDSLTAIDPPGSEREESSAPECEAEAVHTPH